MKSLLSVLTLLWMITPTASAQGHAYETWLGGFFQGPVSGKWTFQGDVHYRAFSDGSPHGILVRPGVGYQVRPGMLVTVGYAWTPVWAQAGEAFGTHLDEHRVWEQWQYEFSPLGKEFTMQVRSRLEQRFRPRLGDEMGLRFRQMVRASHAFNERWLLASWDEVFWAFNKTTWGQGPGFDQNRFFVGMGYVVQPSKLRLELGYFNQFFPGAQQVNHAVMLNTFVGWK